jgi:hypothetical protein
MPPLSHMKLSNPDMHDPQGWTCTSTYSIQLLLRHACLCACVVTKWSNTEAHRLCVQLGVCLPSLCTGTLASPERLAAVVYHVGRPVMVIRTYVHCCPLLQDSTNNSARLPGKGVDPRQDSTSSAVLIGHTGGSDPVAVVL